MNELKKEDLAPLFKAVSIKFIEKKDELCAMDAKMGDGDLGITMEKGYSALPDLIISIYKSDLTLSVGDILKKAGMEMAGIVPSTMGTLMSSGIMYGGKAISNASQIGAKEFCEFLNGFREGIEKRGKCSPGDRTILDAVIPSIDEARNSYGNNMTFEQIVDAAYNGAQKGVEATKDMVPKYGKAAVHANKAIGTPDQGATAYLYLLEGIARFIHENT